MNTSLGILNLLILLSVTAFAQRPGDAPLDDAIVQAIEAIPANSLSFPPQPDIGDPPDFITEAGENFVAAWRIYQTITKSRPAGGGKPTKKDVKLINAHEEWEKFDDLLKRTVESEKAPEVSEYSKFTYSSLDWCGDGVMAFSSKYQKGLALAYLRNGKPFEALLILGGTQQGKPNPLLRAFGIDPEEFLIGEWLSKKTSPDRICKLGGEKTAGMIMDWIDLHFETELQRRSRAEKDGHYNHPVDLPYFPRTDITQLLSPDNGVTDKTKSRIIDYIESRGFKITPLGNWLYSCPKGSEIWLAPIALRCLGDPMNGNRKRAANLLERAGVEHEPLVLRPDPKFRVLVNGEPWPGILENHHRLSLSVKSEKSGFAGGIKSVGNGIVTCDADHFRGKGKLLSAALYVYPYIWGKIELPVKFEEMNVVNITVGELRIEPVFPERDIDAADMTYAVELDRFEEGHPPDGSTSTRTVENQEPYVLKYLSPGEYWLRIRHPGAVLEPRRRITITEDNWTLKPELVKGSSIVVPVDWPERAEPESLPPELGRMLLWRGSSHHTLPSLVQIKGENLAGREGYIATPEASIGRFPYSVIFPYLPPGKYTIECPERTIEPTGTSPGCVIKRSSIEVEIKKDSPAFVTTEPLKIFYTRKD